MTVLDTLIYDPERLACTEVEKETCLETVRELARLSKTVRKEGWLALSCLENAAPFFQVCMQEVTELDGQPETLERVLCAYLAAGNYRGGDFLNAVMVVKAALLMERLLAEGQADDYSRWGRLLFQEIRGFFGAEYRERVMELIAQETKTPNTREASYIPDFDRFAQLDLPQRQALLRKSDLRDITLALKGASGRTENAILEAMTEQARAMLEDNLKHLANVRLIDVTQPQEALLRQWGLVEPGETLEPSVPENELI